MYRALLVLTLALLALAPFTAAKSTIGTLTARPLFIADTSTPAIVAPCASSTASTPLIYYPLTADTSYTATFLGQGTGTVTLVAGLSSAVLTLPCNPCRLAAPAVYGPNAIQISLTVSGASCPALDATLSNLNLMVTP